MLQKNFPFPLPDEPEVKKGAILKEQYGCLYGFGWGQFLAIFYIVIGFYQFVSIFLPSAIDYSAIGITVSLLWNKILAVITGIFFISAGSGLLKRSTWSFYAVLLILGLSIANLVSRTIAILRFGNMNIVTTIYLFVAATALLIIWCWLVYFNKRKSCFTANYELNTAGILKGIAVVLVIHSLLWGVGYLVGKASVTVTNPELFKSQTQNNVGSPTTNDPFLLSRRKALDARMQADLNQAQFLSDTKFTNNNYASFCASPEVQNLISDIKSSGGGDVICNSRVDGWVMQGTFLAIAGYYCVDSKSTKATVNNSVGGSFECGI